MIPSYTSVSLFSSLLPIDPSESIHPSLSFLAPVCHSLKMLWVHITFA
jgi:hypothetical protein